MSTFAVPLIIVLIAGTLFGVWAVRTALDPKYGYMVREYPSFRLYLSPVLKLRTTGYGFGVSGS